MTHSTELDLLAAHPSLAALPEELRHEVLGAIELRRFAIGQNLVNAGEIPAEVLLILEGSARLLGQLDNRLVTIEKLGPGSWVGLASLLRADPCEEVAASDTVLAGAISDQVAVRLIGDPRFYAAFCARPFKAELLPLLHNDGADRSKVQHLLSRLEEPDLALVASPETWQQRPGDRQAIAASFNLPDHSYGTVIPSGAPWPTSRPPLPPRLLLLKPGAQATGNGHGAAAAATTTDLQNRPVAAGTALASSLDLGQTSLSQRPRFRLIRGEGPLDETLACLQMLAAELELPIRQDSIEKILRDVLRRGKKPDLQLCGNLASTLGLHVSAATVPAAMGNRLKTPSLVPWKDGFAVVRASNAAGLLLASPRDGELQLSIDEVAQHFPNGITLLMAERTSETPEKRFGPSWFIPAIKRYRGVLIQVLLASFVVQLFSLAGPLLIQVVIDKVISQRSMDTLQVLGIALVVVTIMEGVLGSLRTFLFTDTSNRIDLRLGAEVIDHLLRLPLNYFDKRPVGELGSRIAELEKIRNFLTGQALSTVLDAALSVVYIIVMVVYSWLLTLIALGVLPIQIALTLLGAPLFRRQYRDAAQENAQTQSHLVEVLTAIQTVKAQNIEMVSRWKWQDFYSRYISRTFEKTITGTALTETSQVLQKISQLLVLWVGATLVLKGEISLGQLIAFRIIAGYVTQPLLRLSTIWQNIQELKVSFERLADVVDTPEESNEKDKRNIPLPPINGQIKFERLKFSFIPNQPPVLNDIDLEIPAGTFVGVVGQSGSGKSTLTKMLSRLYAPNDGRILIDGYDISKVELYSLRRQIGIVPQEPLLFSGSVADNIALGDPDASNDAIVNAAKLACAHDFIMELPAGYSSDVGERGAGLSGGQKQRITLARTLLLNPRLLILDEATSALDYETERRVCDNLLASLQHCTVFFITHRLSTIRRADLIVVMHQGAIAELGTHDQLMAKKGRYYALYRQQEAN